MALLAAGVDSANEPASPAATSRPRHAVIETNSALRIECPPLGRGGRRAGAFSASTNLTPSPARATRISPGTYSQPGLAASDRVTHRSRSGPTLSSRAMSRALRFAPLVLAAVLAGGCSGDDRAAQATTGRHRRRAGSAAKITLRVGRTNTAPGCALCRSKHGADGVPDRLLRLRGLGRGPYPGGVRCSPGRQAACENGPSTRAASGRHRDRRTRTARAGRPLERPIKPSSRSRSATSSSAWTFARPPTA